MPHGTIEVIEREFSDAGFGVRRDVRAVNRAQGRINGQAARKRPAAGRRVAGGAISRHGQIAATLDGRRHPRPLSPAAICAGMSRQERKDQGAEKSTEPPS